MKQNALFFALLISTVQAQASVPGSFVRYQSCSNAEGGTVDLYAETSAEGTTRSAVLTLFNFAYLGTANTDLTSFVSQDGKIRVRWSNDEHGHAEKARVAGPGFRKSFGQCEGKSRGGESVNVHN